MKVLFVSMQFDPRRAQGAERYIVMLADGLAQRGHEVVVLAGDPARSRPRAFGELVHPAPRTLHMPSHGWTAVEGLARRNVAALLATEKPDLVHVVSPAHIGIGALLEAQAAGIRTVVTVVDFWWICPKHTLQHDSGRICDADVSWLECTRCVAASHQRRPLVALSRTPVLRSIALPTINAVRALLGGAPPAELLRVSGRRQRLLRALDQADDVIFLSTFGAELLGPRLRRARRHLIPVGMEPRWFAARRATPFDPSPRDPDRLTIGFIGALEEHKGPHLLLDAIRQLNWRKTRIILAGGGNQPQYAERLRSLAAGMSVEFRGRVPTAGIPALLVTLDLLAVTSTWPENQPQTVLEALATNTPLLTSDVAGIREVLADDAPRFKSGDATSLANALKQWVACPLPARPSSPVPTVEQMLDRTLGIYRRAADQMPRSQSTPSSATR